MKEVGIFFYFRSDPEQDPDPYQNETDPQHCWEDIRRMYAFVEGRLYQWFEKLLMTTTTMKCFLAATIDFKTFGPPLNDVLL